MGSGRRPRPTPAHRRRLAVMILLGICEIIAAWALLFAVMALMGAFG